MGKYLDALPKRPPMPAVVLPSICLFLTSGRTFTFREVTLQINNESVIEFLYVAMSDGRQKRATFYKPNIAGISITPAKEPGP